MKSKAKASPRLLDDVRVGLHLLQRLFFREGCSPRLNKHAASLHANLLFIAEQPLVCKKVGFGTGRYGGSYLMTAPLFNY